MMKGKKREKEKKQETVRGMGGKRKQRNKEKIQEGKKNEEKYMDERHDRVAFVN